MKYIKITRNYNLFISDCLDSKLTNTIPFIVNNVVTQYIKDDWVQAICKLCEFSNISFDFNVTTHEDLKKQSSFIYSV